VNGVIKMGSASPQASPSRQNHDQAGDKVELLATPPHQAGVHDMEPVEQISFEGMAIDVKNHPLPPEAPPRVRTPEPRPPQDRINGRHNGTTERSPSTPGHLAAFDWEDFEARYEQALADANQQEQQLLEEFDQLVKARLTLSSVSYGCC
jgi:hypothetical protein